MIEEWKIWKETYNKRWGNNVWMISNYGRVKLNGEFVDCKADNGGRIYVGHTKYRLHRVVAELFIGPIPKGYVIDHIDTNPSNNNVNNLRICTQKENINNPLTIKHRKESNKMDFYKEDWYKNKQSLTHIGKKHSIESKAKMGKNRNRHREYYEDGTYHYVTN